MGVCVCVHAYVHVCVCMHMYMCVCARMCVFMLLGTGQKDKAETGFKIIGISISEKQYTILSFSSS